MRQPSPVEAVALDKHPPRTKITAPRNQPSSVLKFDQAQLSYCTNIHPAETWRDTRTVLESHVLAVRQRLRDAGLMESEAPFAIGLRLSARAAAELLEGGGLSAFTAWLEKTNTYVFTINGFPYGDFHGTRVKERVFQPDWTDRARLEYTQNLFRILAAIAKPGTGASVSTLPGSHKTFDADEASIIAHLIELADWLDELAAGTGLDFHLGLEPEPLGHFENTAETVAFFERLHAAAPDTEKIRRRIGLNYDACHFALEYDAATDSLDAITAAGIRLSKIHLSAAVALDPRNPAALEAIQPFDEPVYFHQSLLRAADNSVTRFPDLPDLFTAISTGTIAASDYEELRVHFHIPLDAEPAPPLRSTRDQAAEVLAWKRAHPTACLHYEIETYTWGVLPEGLQRPVDEQIAGEYAWVLAHGNARSLARSS